MDTESTVILVNQVDSLVSPVQESTILYATEDTNVIQEVSPSIVVQEVKVDSIVDGYFQSVAGVSGEGGIDKHYVHIQSIPSEQWLIIHNLNKRPSVTVVDSSGSTVEGEVEYLDAARLIVSFAAGFSGTAYLN